MIFKIIFEGDVWEQQDSQIFPFSQMYDVYSDIFVYMSPMPVMKFVQICTK